MPVEQMTQTQSPESTASQSNQAEVYAIHGADPEVLAYAMAKYSRSALSMKESLRELNAQKAEQFLNTFYFQYGHRSIADLAHIALAVEQLSILAAITLVDEQRWDGQERSTRYQNFRKSGWHTPEFSGSDEVRGQYTAAVKALFDAYEQISQAAAEMLRSRVPKPAEMKQEAYERTLRARAFDGARYLLPLASNTSLGEIVNARTLEMQVSRLLSHTHAEVRGIGEKMRVAAASPSWNVQRAALADLQHEIAALDPALGRRTAEFLLRDVPVAPTLVKYAAPSDYQRNTRADLEQAACELMQAESITPVPIVDLIEPEMDGQPESLEIEIASTLLYGACHYPYRQIRDHVAALDKAQRDEIVSLGTKHRGKHDELLRAFASGYQFRFDILMDIGGFRDMHRHRRCVQTLQSFTHLHGYEVPELLADSDLRASYEVALRNAHCAFDDISRAAIPEPNESAQYLLPLGTRCRSLFKMDFSEALYIAELRSAPQGHISYRRVAWEMMQAIAKKHPALKHHFRVTDVNVPVDPLQR